MMKIPQTVIKPFGVLGFPTPIAKPLRRVIQDWEHYEVSVIYKVHRHGRDCTCNWCRTMTYRNEEINATPDEMATSTNA